jgi:hypothetical protein
MDLRALFGIGEDRGLGHEHRPLTAFPSYEDIKLKGQ